MFSRVWAYRFVIGSTMPPPSRRHAVPSQCTMTPIQPTATAVPSANPATACSGSLTPDASRRQAPFRNRWMAPPSPTISA